MENGWYVKRLLASLLCLAILVATTSRSHAETECANLLAQTPPATSRAPDGKLPRHVFLLILENEGFSTTFREHSTAPYLNCLAKQRGQLLDHYFGIGHYSLDNYIAMISGQAPNLDTQNDCQSFTDFKLDALLPDGQAKGHGCVYPSNVSTIANQLSASDKHLTWGGYMEDMRRPCEHPQIGDCDGTQKTPTDD